MIENNTIIDQEKLQIIQKPEVNLVDLTLQGEEHVDVSSLSGEELRIKALDLRRTINTAAIDLAEVLHEMYQSEKWREFEVFDTFAQYVEAELEIGYRSAMYSIKIVASLKTHNIPMEQARQLGWSKLRSLLPHITSKNAISLLEMASTRSVREIQTELKDSGVVTPATPETTKINFNCSPSEASVIFDTLDSVKQKLNTESMSSALEFLCQEYLMAEDGDTSRVSIENIITFCERNYGVTLVISEGSQQEVGEMVE